MLMFSSLSPSPQLPASMKAMITLAILIITGAIAVFVPPDMDSFIQFQPIGCTVHSHPGTVCGKWDLTVAGFIHWQRAYDFHGLGIYSLIYYPLYLVFPVWQSAIALNLLWMGLTLFFFVRLTRINPWIAALVWGGNFFFVYNMLHDYQVDYNIVLCCAVPWLVNCILAAHTARQRLALNVILGIAVFLSLEYKPVITTYAPVMVILAIIFNKQFIANTITAHTLCLRMLKTCSPALILIFTLSLLIIFARLPNGSPFLNLLQVINLHYESYTQFLPYLTHVKNLLVTYMLNFPNSGGIIYGQQDLALVNGPLDMAGVVITAPFWMMIAWLYWRFYRAKVHATDPSLYHRSASQITLLLVSALMTLLLIGINTKTRHAFHLLPVMICVLGATAVCLDYLYRYGQIRLGLPTVMLLATQLLCTAYVLHQEPRPPYAWDRIKALDYVAQPSIANRAIIANLDWGTYFMLNLYGAPHQMLYGGPHGIVSNQNSMQTLQQLANENHRLVVFIGKHDRFEAGSVIFHVFPKLRRLYPPHAAAEKASAFTWEVWGEDKLLETSMP